MNKNTQDNQENTIINLIKNKFEDSDFTDDCAFIKNKNFLVSSDCLVENIHFLPDIKPEDLGWKSVAVNLSDIAASGGIPKYITICLALDKNKNLSYFNKFFDGVKSCCSSFNTKLIGGDLTASDNTSFVSVTAIGELIIKNMPASRNLAKPEDKIIITHNNLYKNNLNLYKNSFGCSAGGLWALKNKISLKFKNLVKSHLRPTPRVLESQELLNNILKNWRKNSQELKEQIPAIIDSSDGLLDCLKRLAKESNVCIEIDLNKIPVPCELKNCAKLANICLNKLILTGGEDYELVASVRKNQEINNNHWLEIGKVKSLNSNNNKNNYLIIKNNSRVINIQDFESCIYNHFKN